MKNNIIFLLVLVVHSVMPGKTCGWESHNERRILFDKEKLTFSMIFHGVSAANASMQSTVRANNTGVDSLYIAVAIKTKSIYNLLFHVKNYYESYLDINSGLPFLTRKKIDQKNIKQNFEIIYDRDKQKSFRSGGEAWPITPDCMELFSMLYEIRRADLKVNDQVNFVLDIEGQLWKASGVIENGKSIGGSFSHLNARMIELYFKPFTKLIPRKWKTDLLTNRISKKGSKLLIYLGPKPESLPLLLRFGHDGSMVEMKLKERTVLMDEKVN